MNYSRYYIDIDIWNAFSGYFFRSLATQKDKLLSNWSLTKNIITKRPLRIEDYPFWLKLFHYTSNKRYTNGLKYSFWNAKTCYVAPLWLKLKCSVPLCVFISCNILFRFADNIKIVLLGNIQIPLPLSPATCQNQ